ncbi:pentatricopeptide repeat-containing protein [Striga asiatica]|uniref:Pentatricopeptide repeat-containing protein n=1 Tax=Striga asiatica TaxID=4170 RepID=A0A5A7P432_STRAF|nr:pentatricopeptide repeat-containing protein [Striga asiatica]
MAVNFSCQALSRRIPKWVSLDAHLSSLSCAAAKLQATQEPAEIQSNPSDLEPKIQLLKNSLHPDSLISVLGATADLNSSMNIFKWASLQKTFNHTADTYHMMILKLGMAGKLEEMESFCNEMVRDNKCRDFEKCLLASIDSFVANQRLCEALRVLYVLNSTGFKPSVDSFNGLMGALVKEKRGFKDMLFVYKEMVKSGTLPNVETLNYLMEVLLESGRVDLAVDQYKRMEKKGCVPNIRTFQIMIGGLVAGGRVQDSILILEDMFRSGCEPDSSFYSCIIPVFCTLHNLEISLRLFGMMKASGMAPDSVAYGAMIRCMCKYLHLNDAIELFKEMVDGGLLPDDLVCLDIVSGLCKSNKLSEAESFLEERNIIEAGPHNALLESYCFSGGLTEVKLLFDKMLKRNITDARSWNILIRFLCENAVIDKASECLSRMIKSCYLPDSASYSALILGNCKSGKFLRALDLFSRIRSKGWVLDSFCYGELMECLCKGEKVQEAIEVFNYMSGEGCSLQSMTFSVLIDKMCAGGAVKSAIKLLSLAYHSKTATSISAYNSILRSLSKLGQKSNFFLILSRMIVIGCAFDTETYYILIHYMSALNRKRDCASVFKLMLSEGLMPDSHILACLGKYSQLHLVVPLLDKVMSGPEILDSAAYNVLIDGLWRKGYRNEAGHLLDLMLERGWVPEASTHSLLMGSITSTKMVSEKVEGNIGGEDYVSSILEEGLGEM